jgi:hypothetical protein
MRILDDEDDGSGKGKGLDLRSGRHLALTVAFVLGACIGVVAAERVYLATNRADILAGVSTMGGAAGVVAAASAAAPVGGPPRGAAPAALSAQELAGNPELKALQAYLEQVAPEGEVLIGVSNKNPMLEGMLDTWLEGVRGAGVRAEVQGACWVAGWLGGWLAGWLAGWLGGWLAGLL